MPYQATRPPGIEKTFVAWVDIAKGIGITLVVFGHISVVFEPIAAHSLSRSMIYTFHMPLFFFISGYLHRINDGFLPFLRKKTIHLLVPYLSFTVIILSFQLAYLSHHGKLTGEALRHTLFVVVWGGAAMTGPYGVLWFLTCLFLTQQLANWLLARLGPRAASSVAFTCLILSYANANLLPGVSLPLDANVVLAALPFFVAGYLCRKVSLSGWWLALVSVAGVVATVILVRSGISVAYDMRAGIYGVPYVTQYLSFSCILCVIFISGQLAKTPFRKLLQSLGKGSLGIMLIHKEIPLLPGFDWVVKGGELVTVVATLALSYIATLLLSRYSIPRALLFGSEIDFALLSERPGARRQTIAVDRLPL